MIMKIMDFKMFTTACILVIGMVIAGVSSPKCYSCVYIHNVDSQRSCSDPWSWSRDKFNVFTGPPKRDCEHACMKIVIAKPGEFPTVVRTCGAACNETTVGTTTTTCCESELCNGAPRSRTKILPVLAAIVTLMANLRR